MAQFARPDADQAAGSWTTTPLWSDVDEGTPGDDVVITSDAVGNNTNTSNADLRLSNVVDPAVSTGHIIRARWNHDTPPRSMAAHAELWQGIPDTGTLVASLDITPDVGTTEVENTYTLTGTEADNITDYNDLFIRLWGRGTGGGPARSLVVEFVELEVPDAAVDRQGQVSWFELETPLGPRQGQVSWFEFETPLGPRQGQVSWFEFETPLGPRQGQVSWWEFETPLAPARGQVSWFELETPLGPRQGQISWWELEVPLGARQSQVSWWELETPLGPRQGQVSWMELETPLGPRQCQVSWFEFETPFGARQVQVSWFEFETPLGARRAMVSWTEFELALGPRQGQVSWVEVEIPSAAGAVRIFWQLRRKPPYGW